MNPQLSSIFEFEEPCHLTRIHLKLGLENIGFAVSEIGDVIRLTSAREPSYANGMAAMSISPLITHIEWGTIQADGVAEAKDLKLYPGGGRVWDWSETGTRHRPGIQPADVQELIDYGSEVVVLSRGMHLVLQTQAETLALLKGLNIPTHILETGEAVALYNDLRKTHRVGGLFHSTC